MASVAMFGNDFSLAQMEVAVESAYSAGYAQGSDPYDQGADNDLESVALIICEAAKLPMLDIMSALQRLAEYREGKIDHPV